MATDQICQMVKDKKKAKVLTPFNKHFNSFTRAEVVKRLFGERTEEVLSNLKVELLYDTHGYMAVSDIDGHIKICVDYLKKGDPRHVHLDLIHELTHVKQFQEGKELFDQRFNYIDRPTEIEAYRKTVEEARNIGMNDTEILEYLKTEDMSQKDLQRLAVKLNIK